jgi:16S rRNA (guanine966-N2)-methyltransferase
LRESLFNILAERIRGAAVLDLFAGTGALGIEALSRGADRAVFIDNAPAAITLIERNLAACRLLTRSRVIRWDAVTSLDVLSAEHRVFDLVLMDPPYQSPHIAAVMENLHQSGCLVKDACVVVEYARKTNVPATIIRFRRTALRRHGKTLVAIFNYVL